MKKDDFMTPSKQFREVPFWSWNDDLDPAELRRQIGLMDEAGWGGFFMHSRIGLRTPYLGKKWMECIRTCVEEAKERGMGAWLYDEDKWPSGYAGGLTVTQKEHRAQALVCLVDNKPALLAEAVTAFTARREGGVLSGFSPLRDLTAFDGDRQSLVQFYVWQANLGSPWFNGYSYFNPLNPQAVRAFLDSTHEAYARECGHEFGKTIPGIFTDEPAYLDTTLPGIGVTEPGAVNGVPWVDDLPQRFLERWGYDLLPVLPSLFFDSGDYTRVRYHFWRLVTERFVDAFTRQVYEWCETHHLPLTGHYLLEDSLWYQVRWNGAVMPHYEYEHIPGIDKLGRNLYTPLTVKQLDSAACQLGKPRTLCESYGCSGGDFSFAGRKWIGDWLYVLGVNLNNPHLSLYSMRGERKRDYPANLFYPQPWWKENRILADYFARLSYALSTGKRVVDILVIHPIGSAWTRYRPDAIGEVGFLDESLTRLEKTLLNAQRDFHYGDEMLMVKYAGVERQDGQAVLRVGEMCYRVVILPPSYSLNRHTAALLRDFAAAGGTILSLPPAPAEIEGVPQPNILPDTVKTVSPETILSALDECLPFDVRVADQPTVWVHHRRAGEMDWYFLCNTSLEEGGTAQVELRGKGRLERWDLLTGKAEPLAVEVRGGITRIELDFPPIGSHLLVLHRDQPPMVKTGQRVQKTNRLVLPDLWKLELLEPNALTLDWAAVRIGDGAWSQPMYILDAHKKAANAGVGSHFTLRFTVEAEKAPQGTLFLVVEDPQRYAITLNGESVSPQDDGYWRDISFRRLDITGKMVKGQNTIELSGVFSRDTELESIYLVGNFGVAAGEGKFEGSTTGQVFYRYPPQFKLVELPVMVKCTDLTPQGLPFFAGRVRLSMNLHLDSIPTEAAIVLEDLRAALAHVLINGEAAGFTAWQPFRVDLGNRLKAGENRLEIELVSTLRNLLGPHHQRGGDPEAVGPESFRMNPLWIDDYTFVPFGFKKAALVF